MYSRLESGGGGVSRCSASHVPRAATCFEAVSTGLPGSHHVGSSVASVCCRPELAYLSDTVILYRWHAGSSSPCDVANCITRHVTLSCPNHGQLSFAHHTPCPPTDRPWRRRSD